MKITNQDIVNNVEHVNNMAMAIKDFDLDDPENLQHPESIEKIDPQENLKNLDDVLNLYDELLSNDPEIKTDYVNSKAQQHLNEYLQTVEENVFCEDSNYQIYRFKIDSIVYRILAAKFQTTEKNEITNQILENIKISCLNKDMIYFIVDRDKNESIISALNLR